MINVTAELRDYGFYNEDGSWVNFRVTLWFQLNGSWYEIHEYIAYVRDNVVKKGSQVDNDYLLAMVPNPMTEIIMGTLLIVAVLLEEHFKTYKAILRSTDFYVEVNYGFINVELSYI